MCKKRIRLGVLISGRGSNLFSIIQNINKKKINAEIAIVISNNSDAKGIDIAKDNGINTEIVENKMFSSKDQYEKKIEEILKKNNCDLIVLAGYLKILGSNFIDTFKNRIINIHPSLLPAFKGLDAQRQAFEYGVKFSGCTVHYVDKTLDGGPIISQDIVAIEPNDTEATLSKKILEKEHSLYPKAIQTVIETMLGEKNESIN